MPILNAAERLLRWALVLIIAAMTILITLNVILRYGFNSNLTMTEEVGRYLFVWMTFLGAISAFVRGRHVRVDSIVKCWSPALQRLAAVVGNIGMLVCCGMVAIGCWRLTLLNTANYLPVSDMPVSVLYFAGVPFSVIVGIMLLVRLWRNLSGRGDEGATP